MELNKEHDISYYIPNVYAGTGSDETAIQRTGSGASSIKKIFTNLELILKEKAGRLIKNNIDLSARDRYIGNTATGVWGVNPRFLKKKSDMKKLSSIQEQETNIILKF